MCFTRDVGMQGTENAFVRDVKAAPEPQCILFLDSQLADMERFLVNDQDYGILTVDPTYNLGQFYVTATTYPHLLLQDVTTRRHPSILGPVLVHQRMDFASFNYFSNTLIGFNKKLRNVRAFGTDGQESLIDSFSHSFPTAVQLRCFIHMKKNVAEKLKECGLPTSVAQEIISDIFGKHCGSTYSEGLVDATSVEHFDERLAKCEEVWNAREMPYAPLGGPRFFDYFRRYKSSAVCYTMRRDIRESVGLGSPPEIFTTNASESINALMKRKVDYKESEWPHFNAEVGEVVKQQQEEIVRALSGRGQFRLLPQFSHYSVSATTWTRMKPEQRREVINKFSKATMKSKQSTMLGISSGASCSYRRIVVNPENSGITKLTLSTLQCIWEKAEELINNDNAITTAPGSDTSARMVLSYSSPVPHLVSKNTSGQYKCDSNCLNWVSSGLCSHSLAVAEMNGDVVTFLNWYKSSTEQPNITSVAMTGLPSGRGRKGGNPKRVRSRDKKKAPEMSIPRPVFQLSGNSPAVSSSESTATVNVVRPGGVTSQSVAAVPRPAASLHQSFPSAIVGQVNMGSSLCSHTTVGLNQVLPCQPNINPFYVKFIQGNIRMCQGCHSTVRSSDGSIPAPPFDLVIARAERRTFRDKSGVFITPYQEQTCHYHVRLDCIKSVEPSFIPMALNVPQDVIPLLSAVHIEYLHLVFGLNDIVN